MKTKEEIKDLQSEIKVFVINRGLYEGDYSDMSDEDFKSVAELEGAEYTLKEFENLLNSTHSGVRSDLHIIRFINVKV